MTRPKITLCVVVMDRADTIEACLRSADFVDELVVVDSHSTDRTRDLAAACGARVIERDWPGYIEQKNFALGEASHDWVLCLDADERLSPELRASILAMLERGEIDADRAGAPSGFEFARRNWYFGRWSRHSGWYPDRKLRLFRRSVGGWAGTNPHDHVYLEAGARVARLDGDILHHSYRSLSDHLRTIDSFTTIAAREKRARGERAGLLSIVLRPLGKFFRTYLLKAGFLDGTAGFCIAISGAYYVFLKYAKLREMDGDGTHDATR